MRRLRFAAVAFFCLALPSVVLGQGLAGPAEGKARVYVFHFPDVNPAYRGDIQPVFGPAQLFNGHSYVGFVDPGQCYGFDLDPGTHVLWSKYASQKWFLRAEVEAGRTYYVHLLLIPPKWVGPPRPSLINAGADNKRRKRTLKQINKRLAKHAFFVWEPATAEHLEAMQEKLGPMIEQVMATWDETWANESRWDVLHEADYVK